MKTLGFALAWVLCAITGVVALVWMIFSALFGTGQRALRIAVAMDQVGNATAGGDEDETWSARCWRLRSDPHYLWWVRRIDRLFEVFTGESNHCEAAFSREKLRRKRPYDDKG